MLSGKCGSHRSSTRRLKYIEGIQTLHEENVLGSSVRQDVEWKKGGEGEESKRDK